MAYVAAEYHSLAAALNALSDDNAITRRHAYTAQQEGDVASWAWALEVKQFSELNPADRMVEVTKFLTTHAVEFEDLRERLAL